MEPLDVVRVRNGLYSVSQPPTKDGIEYAIVELEHDRASDNYRWRCRYCDKYECPDIDAVTQFRRQAGIT